ncbi:MAG: glycoside hydrolase family 3 domain protein [Aeromicrobium sp.]|nr:glycoside hydrolase family 3 domain protein [Aeromicrobium sp.]
MCAAATATTITALAAASPSVAGGHRQPALSTRDVPIIAVDGLRFRDLDRSGDLTPYEDWRLRPARRAADLTSRLSLEEKAGLMVHGTLATVAGAYDTAANTDLIGAQHISTFITRLSGAPATVAEQSNAIQSIAEQQPWGIPVVISSDPRNGFTVAQGQTVPRVGNTAFPDPIGMAAAHDIGLTRTFGDIVRREYRAVGIHEGLSPQADIATEPRWSRINGTFGSEPRLAKRQVNAYVRGVQAGSDGLDDDSVAAVVKHWVGYGAQGQGFDSHYFFGRYATFPGNSFAAHIIPFTGAFEADVAGVMPTYSILKDLVYRGVPVEQVGAGFNRFLLTDLLRGRYGFSGVIVSDWGITGDCPQACQDNRGPSFIGPWGVGMPWGLIDATKVERFARAINAGVDQLGGSNEPSFVVQAVGDGLITPARVDASARRVLTQKFELGLFENPYVDPAAAARVNGNERFQAVGDEAQAASLTLLTNRARTLPASERETTKVYLSGVSAEAATARGLEVAATPAEADLAVVRLRDPAGGPDRTDLNFTGSEADYGAFQAAADSGTPTVAVPNLSRPLVLTNVADRADAVLADYGVSDEVLLETIFGDRSPRGRLPMELPRSMAQVTAQAGDVPDDISSPLFDVGFGLSYRHHSHSHSHQSSHGHR